MIGIRPGTRRKIKYKGNGNLSNTIRLVYNDSGNSPVFDVSLGGVRSAYDKYADTWERKNGRKHATRVREKRGAIRTITAPPEESNGRGKLIDFLDYGDVYKIVFEIPGIFDKNDVEMEHSGDYIRVTAPGFSKEILTAGQSLKSWNYANGIIEINMWK